MLSAELSEAQHSQTVKHGMGGQDDSDEADDDDDDLAGIAAYISSTRRSFRSFRSFRPCHARLESGIAASHSRYLRLTSGPKHQATSRCVKSAIDSEKDPLTEKCPRIVSRLTKGDFMILASASIPISH